MAKPPPQDHSSSTGAPSTAPFNPAVICSELAGALVLDGEEPSVPPAVLEAVRAKIAALPYADRDAVAVALLMFGRQWKDQAPHHHDVLLTQLSGLLASIAEKTPAFQRELALHAPLASAAARSALGQEHKANAPKAGEQKGKVVEGPGGLTFVRPPSRMR